MPMNIFLAVHSASLIEISWTILFCAVIAAYVLAVFRSNRTYKPWPMRRTLCWIAGMACALAAVVGPIAQRGHEDFVYHMVGHLLLGMLAPLLLVLAAPMTLVFRTLPVKQARTLASLLRKSRYVRFVSHPITASFLNIGGLWLLYRTPLFHLMHAHDMLYCIVHIHVFMAGYLFAASMIYIDPTPHRYRFLHRAVVFLFALAGHGILSKLIYASPPAGVDPVQAKTGAMLMYYGGDLIDFVIILILFYGWYQHKRPSVSALRASSQSQQS